MRSFPLPIRHSNLLPQTVQLQGVSPFPIPLGGYIGPASDVGINYSNFSDILVAVSVAWMFYGIIGGFVVLAMGGAAASHLAFHESINRGNNEKKVLVVLAACVSFLGCGTLAILDYIIGPW